MQTLFPTAYFGSISYYAQLVQAEEPAIETCEHFIKQTLRTRCSILSSNGILQLSVPVTRKNGSKTIMSEIELSDDTNWRKIHWKAIESAYSSAPFFEHYGVEVKELIFSKERNLIKFNKAIQTKVMDWLYIDKTIAYTTEYNSVVPKSDLRNSNFEQLKESKKYIQVFNEDQKFTPNLSILDLIFCEGPLARNWIISS